MTASDTYEGWTNYETWATNLWIQNNRHTYDLAREIVRDAIEHAPKSWDDANMRLAEMLQANFEPSDNGLDGLRLDLFLGGLTRINWYEIAAEMIAEWRAARV